MMATTTLTMPAFSPRSSARELLGLWRCVPQCVPLPRSGSRVFQPLAALPSVQARPRGDRAATEADCEHGAVSLVCGLVAGLAADHHLPRPGATPDAAVTAAHITSQRLPAFLPAAQPLSGVLPPAEHEQLYAHLRPTRERNSLLDVESPEELAVELPRARHTAAPLPNIGNVCALEVIEGLFGTTAFPRRRHAQEEHVTLLLC
mmetsp:Transcript_85480/g.236879  ORF Transcript_85480/g.236879 Transcript_85480/m.236879 type:complete len:204 (+) Transcript_85480:75-686(+)